MKWFKHQSDAILDAKLRKLKIRYGLEGYGLYWNCLELIARGVDKHNLNFELEHDAELLADEWNIHKDKVQEMMVFMVELGLFENSNGIITCLKMSTITDEYTQKLLSNRKVVGTQSGHSHDIVLIKSELKEQNRTEENRIEEKRKEKKIKPPPHINFQKPSIQEIKQYCSERHNDIDPEQFFDFYESKGWLVGKAKMKNWQAAVRTWERSNVKPKEHDFSDYM